MRGPYEQGDCARNVKSLLFAGLPWRILTRPGGASFSRAASVTRSVVRMPRPRAKEPRGAHEGGPAHRAAGPGNSTLQKIAAVGVARRSWRSLQHRHDDSEARPADRRGREEGRPRRPPSRLLRLLATAGQLRCGKRRCECCVVACACGSVLFLRTTRTHARPRWPAFPCVQASLFERRVPAATLTSPPAAPRA